MQNKIIRKIRLLGDTLSVAALNRVVWLSNRLHDYASTQRPVLRTRNGALTVAGVTARHLRDSSLSSCKQIHRAVDGEIFAPAKPAATPSKFGKTLLQDSAHADDKAGLKNVAHYSNYLSAGEAANALIVDEISQPRQEERRQQQERRNYTAKTMWLCLTSPRRAHGRRRSDRRFPVQDVFGEGALILAAVLMMLSLTDAFLTLNILARGGSEVNPVMNYMLGFGTFAFVATKMFMTALSVAALTAAGNVKIFKLLRVRTVTAILVGMYCALIVYELVLLSL